MNKANKVEIYLLSVNSTQSNSNNLQNEYNGNEHKILKITKHAVMHRQEKQKT